MGGVADINDESLGWGWKGAYKSEGELACHFADQGDSSLPAQSLQFSLSASRGRDAVGNIPQGDSLPPAIQSERLQSTLPPEVSATCIAQTR